MKFINTIDLLCNTEKQAVVEYADVTELE